MDACVKKIRGRGKEEKGRKGKAYESEEITTKAVALAEDEMRRYTYTWMMRGEMVKIGGARRKRRSRQGAVLEDDDDEEQDLLSHGCLLGRRGAAGDWRR